MFCLEDRAVPLETTKKMGLIELLKSYFAVSNSELIHFIKSDKEGAQQLAVLAAIRVS
jgi:hypothetical protein